MTPGVYVVSANGPVDLQASMPRRLGQLDIRRVSRASGRHGAAGGAVTRGARVPGRARRRSPDPDRRRRRPPTRSPSSFARLRATSTAASRCAPTVATSIRRRFLPPDDARRPSPNSWSRSSTAGSPSPSRSGSNACPGSWDYSGRDVLAVRCHRAGTPVALFDPARDAARLASPGSVTPAGAGSSGSASRR